MCEDCVKKRREKARLKAAQTNLRKRKNGEINVVEKIEKLRKEILNEQKTEKFKK